MSQLLLGAHMSIAGGVSHALERANSVGSNAVQIFTKNNRQWRGQPVDQEDVARWQDEMPAQGIAYAVSHASYLINLASPKDDLWEKSSNAHKDELQRAHAYGVNHVVLHPGAHTGSGEEAGIERIAKALNQVHAETPECEDILTLLEVMAGQGTVIGYRFEQLQRIIEQVEEKQRLGICVDTCHSFAAGYDLRTRAGYEAMLDEIDKTVGLDRVKCWHFNDSKAPFNSRKDRHMHIGQGEIGEECFHMIINDARWDGIAMLLETPKKDDLKEDRMNLQCLVSLVEDSSRIPPGLRNES